MKIYCESYFLVVQVNTNLGLYFTAASQAQTTAPPAFGAPSQPASSFSLGGGATATPVPTGTAAPQTKGINKLKILMNNCRLLNTLGQLYV